MTPNPRLQYQIIQQSEYQRMPWKNGLGETLEIQRYEDQNGLRFRISQAAVVEDGVFSDFSGLHRTLVLLSGNGITLDHNNETSHHSQTLDNPLDMARFSGSDKTHATLKNGKIEDLNIMVRDKDTASKMDTGFAPTTLALSKKESLFTGFYANEETIIAFQMDQTDETNTVFIPSQSLIFFKQHRVLSAIQLINGSGVLIAIYKK